MEEDSRCKNVSDLVENLMNANKISNFLGNTNKENAVDEKNSKQKVIKIKSNSPHQDLFWMLRMSIIFFKLIGLATFAHCIVTQKKRTLYTFQYSGFGIVYNIVLSSLIIASNYVSIPFTIDMEYENKTNLTVYIEVVQTVLGSLVICAILFNYCIDQKSLVRIADRLMNVEDEMDRLYDLYRPLRRQRIFFTMISACVLKVFLLILLLATEILAFHTSPISWLTDIIPTFHVGWLFMQYFLLVTIIQADFADVNQAIRSLTRVSTPDLRPQSLYQTRRVVVSNSTVHQLLQLRDMHCHLCEISENVSDFYSLPVLFGITFFFLALIYNSYYLLSSLLIDGILKYETLSNTIVWLIFLFYPIFLLANRITKTLNEMEKTGNIVHDLLRCAIGKETKQEVRNKFNSIFMDANKISNFLRNLNKKNVTAEKNSKQKMTKIKSGSHQSSLWLFKILIMFFKFIGLATFAYRIDTQKKRTSYTFQYSEFGIVCNVVLSILMIASNCLSIPFKINVEYENKSNLTVIIEVVQTVLGSLVICVILFRYCIDQKSLVRIANRLMDVEHEIDRLYHLYPPLRRQRIFCTMISVCVLKIFLLIFLLISEVFAFNTGPVSWLGDVLPTFHVGWLLIQYNLLITVIQANFADVNRAIHNLIRVNTPDLRPQCLYQTRRVVISNSTVHQLLQLRDMHCHLCEISENVSDFYSLPVLFGMTFLFLTLIYNGYYLFSPLLMTDNILEYETFSNTIIWLLFLMYPISLLTNRITKILIEIRKTGNVVNNLLSCAIGKETKSELKQFSLQLLHQKIQFTANGYFALDNSFLHSLVGTVVTYLVILVQFQMGNSFSTRSYYNCTREDSKGE
ncbi:PREDICTED: uncharacterized protein LOC105459234 [Wasmannia auropunctata]|uniref:uncharacterized protein LOC105459234 n=1 Tax=Wasmannia auropunctata TaxID=64793 RepID=UPI0005EF98DA|nr:PREDICTED: uncharacterized protein LOC105459234 [Wasmannia auropunctata]